MTLDFALSTNQRAVQLLARDMLTRTAGDRLPTSLQYQELLDVGSGTVQKGLRVLVSAGAVALRARGHQGTFVVSRHVGRLWAIGGLSAVTGSLPLPDSLEISGLAAGLRNQFDGLGIPLQMLYMHGASNRIRVVEEGKADFAVLSRRASEVSRSPSPGREWSKFELGPHSYYSEGSMVVLESRSVAEPASRVACIGIDRGSFDHTELTLAEFPPAEGFELSEMDYPHLPAAVAEGRIAAAVWHRTSLPVPLELIGVAVRSLARPEAIETFETLNGAVLLAGSDRPEVTGVLGDLDVRLVRDTQLRVLRNEIMPAF